MNTAVQIDSGGSPDIRPFASLAQQPEDHLDYRPDIDGLRAIAVLAVVAFHAFPDSLPGGFVGVDVFFVISGYLISGIILRALGQNRFSILGFYARRVRRIFPALLAMLVLVWVLGRLLMLADEFPQLGKHVLAGSGFAMNLVLYADTEPYFGSINSPLIHLWSLGVEEQFYLVWPLFLMAIWRLPRWRGWLIAAAALASFAMNLHSVATEPLTAFYFPTNRLWELAIGGLLAYLTLNASSPTSATTRSATWANLQATVGLVAIIGSVFMLNQHMVFPGWFALAPCLGATLLISAGPKAWINRVLLSNPLMVFFGLISYPLYLLHWPLLSFAHSADWRGYTPFVKIIVIFVSIALSYALYRFVETPIRRARPMKFAPGLCVAMAASAVVGYLTFTQVLQPRTAPAEVQPFLDAALEPFPYPEKEGLLSYGTGPKHTLYIGDSTVAQYHWRARKLIDEGAGKNRTVEFVWRAGCASDPSMSLVDPADCRKMLDEGLARAKAPEVDIIVVGFCWYAYFMADFAPDRVGAAAPLLPGTEEAIADLERMLSGFVKDGKRVYLVLQTPVDPGYPPRKMIRRTLSSPGFVIDVRPPLRAEIVKAHAPFVDRLKAASKRAGAITIDPMQSLCDANECSPVTAGNTPIFRDPFHLRSSYIRDHVPFLDATVLDTAFTAPTNSE